MKFLNILAFLALWIPQAHSLVISNDEGLFELANRDIRGAQPTAIH
jgi:hypothetical protein